MPNKLDLKGGKEGILRRISKNLILTGRMFMPGAFEVPTPDFHYEVAKTIQNPAIRRLNMQWPRDHAKSTICAGFWPIWHLWLKHLYLGKERDSRFIVIISKAQREAKRRLRTLMDALEHPKAQKLVGDWGRSTARKWTKEEVILKDGSTIVSTGWSQQGRGLKEGHQRPTLLVVDDPEDENNTRSSEQMDNNLEWLLSALEPSVSPEGRICVIGTPIHQRSMVKRLQDFEDWTTHHYRALYEEDGELKSLWPERYSVDELLEKREAMKHNGMGHLFYKEWQCQIVQGEDSPIQPSHFQYWDGTLIKKQNGPIVNHYLKITHRDKDASGRPMRLDEPERIPVVVTMGIDPASSTSRTADYSTVVPVAWAANGDCYVLDYFRERVDPVVHAKEIYRYHKDLRVRQARVESDAYQKMLRSYLNSPEHFDERIPGLEADVKAGGRSKDKHERHLGLQYLFTNGHVHIKPHMETFREEWVMMEDASHDDLRDGFWWAHECRMEPTHSVEMLDDDTSQSSTWTQKDPMLA